MMTCAQEVELNPEILQTTNGYPLRGVSCNPPQKAPSPAYNPLNAIFITTNASSSLSFLSSLHPFWIPGTLFSP
jgi:hypothetical protein